MNAHIAHNNYLQYTSEISKLHLLYIKLSLFVCLFIGALKSASSSVKVVYEFCHHLAALLFWAAKWLKLWKFLGTFATITA